MRPAARDLVVATAFYLGGEQPRLVIVPAGGVAGDIPGGGLQRRAPAAAMVEVVNLHHRPLPCVKAHGVRAGRPIPRMAQHRGAPVQHARQVRRLRFAAPPLPLPRPLWSLPSRRSASGRVSRIERSVWNSSLRALTEAVAIWASREAFSSRSMLALTMRRLPLFFLSGAKSRDPFATCATGRGATCARRRDP